MGNRGGRLHDPERVLGRARWKSRAWICCRTEFRGRRRTVMGRGYTELFFLDEAAARSFAHAWARARRLRAGPPAAEMDRDLHAQRLGPPQTVRHDDLPAGAIYRWGGDFHLHTAAEPRRWTFSGYEPAAPICKDERVVVQTARCILDVLIAGYRPELHGSLTQEVR